MKLLGDPWLPVILRDGGHSLISLRELLQHPQQYVGIHHSSWLVKVSVVRFLAALLGDILEPARDDLVRWITSRFPTTKAIAALTTLSLDISHPSQPLYQVTGLKNSHPYTVLRFGGARHSRAVIHDHTDVLNPPPVLLAEAFLYLLAAQNFAMSSTVTETGYSKRGPLAANIVCYLEGRNLLETLCLNMSLLRSSPPPIWRIRIHTPAQLDRQRENQAKLHPYTPFSRAIDLRGGPDVKLIGYAAGIRNYPRDPMLAYKDGVAVASNKKAGGFFEDIKAVLDKDSRPDVLRTCESAANALDDVTLVITTAKGHMSEEQNIDVWQAHLASPLDQSLERLGELLKIAEAQAEFTQPFQAEKKRTYTAWIAQMLPHYREEADLKRWVADVRTVAGKVAKSVYFSPYKPPKTRPRRRSTAFAKRYATYLETLDSKALTSLESSVGFTPPGYHPCLKLVGKLLLPKTSRWFRHCQVVVAQLYALHPRHAAGVTLARAVAAQDNPRITSLFRTAAGDSREELLTRLTDLFGAATFPTGIDYALLLTDLGRLPSQRVIEQWPGDLEQS